MTRLVLALIVLFVVIIGVTVLVPRLGGESRVQRDLVACANRCHYNSLDLRDVRLGDLMIALGTPQLVSFVDAGGGGPSGAQINYLVEMYYPDRPVMLIVKQLDNAARLTPGANSQFWGESLNSAPLIRLPWRGFAGVCRYYPNLVGQCAAS